MRARHRTAWSGRLESDIDIELADLRYQIVVHEFELVIRAIVMREIELAAETRSGFEQRDAAAAQCGGAPASRPAGPPR